MTADPIAVAARFLAEHLEYARHQSWAEEMFADITACHGIIRSLAQGPASQRYTGPCGALTEPWTDDNGKVRDDCPGETYVRQGASRGRCRRCSATVDTAERQAWLDAEVRAHAFRASEIARAYRINVKTIRTWAGRGFLPEHGRDRDGKPLYLVGAVLDLAAVDAARRAEDQAKRARRAAGREATDERMSA